MATEKDSERAERGVERTKYIRDDVVHRLVRDAAGQAQEFTVQLVFGADLLFALMNNGRIYMTNMDGTWQEYRSPGTDDIEPETDAG